MNRLDIELTARMMVKSRSTAQKLIKDNAVSVNGKIISKPSYEVSPDDEIILTGELPRYVGRGGLKLEKALEEFNISLNDLVCIDAGASTGGFTDCMLQNGAKRVYAVDVGTAQLDETLKNDERVVSLENTDIRKAAEKIPKKADFISVDLSFISLRLVLPYIKNLMRLAGTAVVLIKPQFEVGKSGLGKHGIVKDEKLRTAAVEEIKQFAEQTGFSVNGLIQSPITGGDGNIEYLMYLSLRGEL